MRELLNSSLLRQLRLIETLFYKEEWLTLESVASELKCSEKVLRTDTIYINDHFFPVQVISSKKLGIMLEYPTNLSLDYIYKRVLELSSEFRALEAIFFDEKLTEESLSEHLFISVSTLKRMLKRCNEALGKFGLKIQMSGSSFNIIGPEFAIRDFFNHYFLEKYPPKKTPFTQGRYTFIVNMLHGISKVLNRNISLGEENKWSTWVLSGLERFNQGYSLPVKHRTFSDLDYLVLNNDEWKKEFEKNYQLKWSLETLNQMFAIFFEEEYMIFRLDNLYKDSLEIPLQGIMKERKKIMSAMGSLLVEISTEQRLFLANKEDVVMEVSSIFFPHYSDSFILNDKKRVFCKYLMQEYPRFTNDITLKLQKFLTVQGLGWSESLFFEFLYTLFIWWEDLPALLDENIIPLKVGLLSDLDVEANHFLISLLNRHMEKDAQVELLQSENDFTGFDFLITTFSSYGEPVIPTICINVLPTINNWEEIQQIIHLINQKRVADWEEEK